MSVSIRNLTKLYGNQRAVDNVSFEASRGEITGFLGPNGAGKSTTMKMAVGYLLPTSGSIELDGISVLDEPLSIKRITGYLPEHNPLYLEMYVREFLRFIGSAYGISSTLLKRRMEEMIEMVGLQRECNKKIGQLSKGYRQRVGLAQAMIHDPSVLILDEPTTGLDPNQIIEIREVIRNISTNKTVILSTHIMQEVEAICDKVVIINKGQLVANDSIEVLKSGMETTGIIITFEQPVDVALFAAHGFDLQPYGKNAYLVESEQTELRAELLKITSEHNLPLASLTKSQKSLEEIFHRLTQNQAIG